MLEKNILAADIDIEMETYAVYGFDNHRLAVVPWLGYRQSPPGCRPILLYLRLLGASQNSLSC